MGRSKGLGGVLQRLSIDGHSSSLDEAPFEELVSAMLARIDAGAAQESEKSIALSLYLQRQLAKAIDVHGNRFSPTRYRDLYDTYCRYLNPLQLEVSGATIVDLGCGSINPYGCLFLFLLLGAKRGIAIDLDPVQDLTPALQTLADLTSLMLTNPSRVVGDIPVTAESVLQSAASFDLHALAQGDIKGLNPDRLQHRSESAERLSLADGEVDIVVSNSFFEHVEDARAVIRELARITRPGGVGIHGIDGTDHRRYGSSAVHMLEFLTENHEGALAHGSNRLRMTQFRQLFEEEGFRLVRQDTWIECEIPDTFRARLVEPFRSMPDRVLQNVSGRLVVERIS